MISLLMLSNEAIGMAPGTHTCDLTAYNRFFAIVSNQATLSHTNCGCIILYPHYKYSTKGSMIMPPSSVCLHMKN